MKLSNNQERALQKFRNFVSLRNKISLWLSMVVLICYYAFIVSIGVFPEVLGYRLGPSSITLGIMIGLFLIALCIVATGLYTFVANWYFDRDQEVIIKELEDNGLTSALQSGKISYKEKV